MCCRLIGLRLSIEVLKNFHHFTLTSPNSKSLYPASQDYPCIACRWQTAVCGEGRILMEPLNTNARIRTSCSQSVTLSKFQARRLLWVKISASWLNVDFSLSRIDPLEVCRLKPNRHYGERGGSLFSFDYNDYS